ncbi:methylated-DNA--[protein]-cysteine S-methyltransferase [Bordetella sp. 2513F-2]
MLRAFAASAAPPAYRDVPTPLGPMRLAALDDALCGAWFLDQADLPAPQGWRAVPVPVLRQAEAELQAWFDGGRRHFDVPLKPRGTAFQVQVWAALCELPFGATASYGELARRIGRPRAVRAVGGAAGRNPISLFIPCHRIVGHDTSLTGFGGGLPRKHALLAHEGHRYAGPAARARRTGSGQLALPW